MKIILGKPNNQIKEAIRERKAKFWTFGNDGNTDYAGQNTSYFWFTGKLCFVRVK